jgi:GT2 family glycosyltransferase
MISVVIPTCTDEHVLDLLNSMENLQAYSTEHVILVDSGLKQPDAFSGQGATLIPTALPFVFSRAVNDGIRATGANDILVLNDDTTMLTKNWHRQLVDLLWRENIRDNPTIGMIGLAIAGGVGNSDQEARRMLTKDLTLVETTLCFVAVLIRRHCWDAVGSMDERFIDYGWDDDDYCRRARLAGFGTYVSSEIIVQHGRDFPHSNSFAAKFGWENLAKKMHANQERYKDKWGDYGLNRRAVSEAG